MEGLVEAGMPWSGGGAHGYSATRSVSVEQRPSDPTPVALKLKFDSNVRPAPSVTKPPRSNGKARGGSLVDSARNGAATEQEIAISCSTSATESRSPEWRPKELASVAQRNGGWGSGKRGVGGSGRETPQANGVEREPVTQLSRRSGAAGDGRGSAPGAGRRSSSASVQWYPKTALSDSDSDESLATPRVLAGAEEVVGGIQAYFRAKQESPAPGPAENRGRPCAAAQPSSVSAASRRRVRPHLDSSSSDEESFPARHHQDKAPGSQV